MSSQQSIRNRFAKSFRYVVSQRLVPRKDGSGRLAVVEILKSTLRTQEYVIKGETEGKSMVDAMRDGSTEGMQDFDGEIERLIRRGVIEVEIGLAFSTKPGNLRLQLADLIEDSRKSDAGPLADESSGVETEFEIDR
jgi:twitching motility protein PilT